jgi:hypothetical protein
MSECIGEGCSCSKPRLVASEDGKVRCVDVASGYEVEFHDEKSANESNVFLDGQWSLSQDVPALSRPILAPKIVTRSEMKKYNRAMITRILPKIKECGHSYDEMNQPRTNCEWCWVAWFTAHGEIVKIADECFRAEGRETLVRIRGEKFVKMFLRYMATVADFVKHQKEQNVKQVG